MPKIAKTILMKRNKVRGLTFSDLKNYNMGLSIGT